MIAGPSPKPAMSAAFRPPLLLFLQIRYKQASSRTGWRPPIKLLPTDLSRTINTAPVIITKWQYCELCYRCLIPELWPNLPPRAPGGGESRGEWGNPERLRPTSPNDVVA